MQSPSSVQTQMCPLTMFVSFAAAVKDPQAENIATHAADSNP
jgi:hypothetical protein